MGSPVLPSEDIPTEKKQIAVTRSFGAPVTEIGAFLAVSNSLRGREKNSESKAASAGQLYVFAHTPFRPPLSFLGR